MIEYIKPKKEKSLTAIDDGKSNDTLKQINVSNSDKTSERKDKTYVGGDDITRPLTYVPPSDDELLEVAKSTYENAKQDSIKSATEEAERKKKSLNKSIIDQTEGLKADTYAVENDYKNAEKNLENQLLKRGIQRSSAAIGGVKDLESEKLSAVNKLRSAAKEKIAELNVEIDDLESDLGKEISAINEKYANAVQLRLHELKNERDEKINEVIKYNNTLDLFYDDDYYQEGEKNDDREDVEDVEDVDLNEIKPRYRERIEEVVKDYLAFSDPNEALSLFETNDSVKKYLGKYYDYVHRVLKNNAAS